MSKLITAFVLTVGMMAAMPVLAHDRHHYKKSHHKQWKQNYSGHRGYGYGKHHRKRQYRHDYNHYSPSYSYAPRHYNNDSHWGIVFRYYD